MIYKIMFDLPNLDDKQLMFDSGVTWHLTTTNDRIGKFSINQLFDLFFGKQNLARKKLRKMGRT